MAMPEIIQWMTAGDVKVPNVEIFPMSDIAGAHARLESGQTIGKLVVDAEG